MNDQEFFCLFLQINILKIILIDVDLCILVYLYLQMNRIKYFECQIFNFSYQICKFRMDIIVQCTGNISQYFKITDLCNISLFVLVGRIAKNFYDPNNAKKGYKMHYRNTYLLKSTCTLYMYQNLHITLPVMFTQRNMKKSITVVTTVCSRLFLRLLYSPHHGCKKILHTDNCIRKGGMSYIGLEPWTQFENQCSTD